MLTVLQLHNVFMRVNVSFASTIPLLLHTYL